MMLALGSILTGAVVFFGGIKTKDPLWIVGCTITAFAFMAFGVLYAGVTK